MHPHPRLRERSDARGKRLVDARCQRSLPVGRRVEIVRVNPRDRQLEACAGRGGRPIDWRGDPDHDRRARPQSEARGADRRGRDATEERDVDARDARGEVHGDAEHVSAAERPEERGTRAGGASIDRRQAAPTPQAIVEPREARVVGLACNRGEGDLAADDRGCDALPRPEVRRREHDAALFGDRRIERVAGAHRERKESDRTRRVEHRDGVAEVLAERSVREGDQLASCARVELGERDRDVRQREAAGGRDDEVGEASDRDARGPQRTGRKARHGRDRPRRQEP